MKIKNATILTMLLASCSGAATKNESNFTSMDSVNIKNDEYELTEDDYESMRAKAEPTYYSLIGSVGSGDFMGLPITEFICRSYFTDSLITGNGSSEVEVDFKVEEIQAHTISISSIDSTCQQANIVFTKSVETVEPNENYVLAKFKITKGKPELENWNMFNGDNGATIGDVKLTYDYSLTRTCKTLAIVEETEGGDIDHMSLKKIFFYVIEPSGKMKSILSLETENTNVKEFEEHGDMNKNSTIELRTFKIMPRTSHGFFDIEVKYIQKVNGEIMIDGFEYYSFNGKEYVQQLE